VQSLRTIGALLAAIAIVAGNAGVCAAARGSRAQEMACCKAGHVTCGKMTSASDCCKSRQQSASNTIAAAYKQPEAALAVAAPAAIPALFGPSPVRSSLGVSGRNGDKRPHDPPHLHSFSLLI